MKKAIWKWIGVIIILLILTTSLFFIFMPNDEVNSMPKATNGKLDLSKWNFNKNGIVRLDGQWEFYWNQLLTPEDFSQGTTNNVQGTTYLEIPSKWTQKIDGVLIPKYGFATYRLILKNVKGNEILGIKKENIRMASKIYVNGDLLLQDGVPSKNPALNETSNIPQMAFFQHNKNNDVEIIIQISNHFYVNGGIISPIYLGDEQQIVKQNNIKIIFESALFFILILVGFIYFIANMLGIIYKTNDSIYIIFSVTCILLAICNGMLSERPILLIFPDITFISTCKIRDFTTFTAAICMFIFLNKISDRILPRKMRNFISGLFSIYLLMVIFLPVNQLMNFENIFVAIDNVFFLIAFIRSLILFIKEDYEDIGVATSFSLCIALLCFVIDIFDIIVYSLGKKSDMFIGELSLILCVLSLVFLLSLRFNNAFKDMKEMSYKLLEADKYKDDFLATTAHELKTPIHGIQNLTEAVLDEIEYSLTARQKENLSLVVTISKRLSSLVNDLLDLSKIKHSEIQLTYSSIDIHMCVNSVFQVFQYIISGKKINLINNIQDNISLVYGDENRIRQVLYNLIGNSVKFTHEGSIVVTAYEKENKIFVSIEDTGIGIPVEKREDIFKAYEQSSKIIGDEYGGIGIGLSISKELIECMGGKIYVEWSQVGKGTKFTFALPMANEEKKVNNKKLKNSIEDFAIDDSSKGEDGAVREDLRIADTEFTVLVVDDEVSNIKVIENIFLKENYKIITAFSGEEALKKIKEKRKVDIVLLDVMMPKMSGFEVCRKLRENYSIIDLPVILITAKNTSEDVLTGFEVGANDYITKPFYGQELRARVATYIQLKRLLTQTIASEIAFLQAQIKPHFLYNAISSIIALCYSDSKSAAELLTHLSNYLRRCFDFNNKTTFVSIEKELELVHHYVEIEKTRFGEELQVEFIIDDKILYYQIIPFSIQPLVENAIRHGVMKREDGGTVKIILSEKDNEINVSVEDDGVGMSQNIIQSILNKKNDFTGYFSDKESTGVGISNINNRLIKFYGEGLCIESKEGESTKVYFRIPIKVDLAK